jgi:hypothetical protein
VLIVVRYCVQTEVFDGVLDGRVFRTADVVTFPPVGQGMADAFATSKRFHFSGEYTSGVTAGHCHTQFLLTVAGKLAETFDSCQYE